MSEDAQKSETIKRDEENGAVSKAVFCGVQGATLTTSVAITAGLTGVGLVALPIAAIGFCLGVLISGECNGEDDGSAGAS